MLLSIFLVASYGMVASRGDLEATVKDNSGTSGDSKEQQSMASLHVSGFLSFRSDIFELRGADYIESLTPSFPSVQLNPDNINRRQ